LLVFSLISCCFLIEKLALGVVVFGQFGFSSIHKKCQSGSRVMRRKTTCGWWLNRVWFFAALDEEEKG
jgi:hypothetical protein